MHRRQDDSRDVNRPDDDSRDTKRLDYLGREDKCIIYLLSTAVMIGVLKVDLRCK